jgi:hypothetical protein
MENAQPKDAVKQDQQGNRNGGGPPQPVSQILREEKSRNEESKQQENWKYGQHQASRAEHGC